MRINNIINKIINCLLKHKTVLISIIVSVLIIPSITLAVWINVQEVRGDKEIFGYTGNEITNTPTVVRDLTPDGNNLYDIGAFGSAFNDLFVSGTAFISTAIITISTADGDIRPNTNNTYDLGAFGLAWNNLFVSSTSYLGGATGDQLVVGTSTPFIVKEDGKVGISTTTPGVALEINSIGTSMIHTRWTDAAGGGAGLTIRRSRGALHIDTLVQNGDHIGAITWQGNDGAGSFVAGAQISARVDGTPGANDLPTRLEFSTTADGNSTVTERMRIDSSGRVFPGANNSQDFGIYGTAWRSLYTSTTLFIGGVGTLVTLDNNSLDSEGAFTLQTTGGNTALTFVTAGTGDIILDPGGNNVNPGSNNADDLGSFGTAWKDIYASSTLKVDTALTTGFSYNTSTAWTGTTTIFLAPAVAGLRFSTAYCETDIGTLNVSLHDGTNRADLINASTTIGIFKYSTNNIWTEAESIRFDVGTPVSSPRVTACRLKYVYE